MSLSAFASDRTVSVGLGLLRSRTLLCFTLDSLITSNLMDKSKLSEAGGEIAIATDFIFAEAAKSYICCHPFVRLIQMLLIFRYTFEPISQPLIVQLFRIYVLEGCNFQKFRFPLCTAIADIVMAWTIAATKVRVGNGA